MSSAHGDRFRANPAFRLLSGAVLLATAISLSLSLFVPIYTDEVTWKMTQGRLLRDGGVNIYLYPACGSSFATAPPFYFVPSRLLDELLWGDIARPLALRVTAILGHLAWLAFVAWGLARSLDRLVERWLVLPAFVAACGLGTLPFLLVLSRPEQAMLRGAALFTFAPFLLGSERFARRVWPWALGAALVLAAAALFGAHPKGVFLLPVVWCGLFGAIRQPAARWSALVATTLLAVGSIDYWERRFDCPQDAVVASEVRKGLALDDLRQGDLGALFHRLWLDETVKGTGYTRRILLGNDEFHWLQPDAPLGKAERGLNEVLRPAIGLLALAALTAAAGAAVRMLRTRRLGPLDASTLALSATLVTLALLEVRRTPYEAGYLAMLALLTIATGLRPATGRVARATMPALAIALMLLSLVSQAILWHRFAPRVPINLARPGSLEGQPLSFSPFGYDGLRPQILAAARACGIGPGTPREGLVVDDVTYPALASIARRPLHYLYVSGYWGRGIPDLYRFLVDRRSAGVVVGCDASLRGFGPRVHRTGDFCCVPSFDFPPRNDP